MKKTVCSYHCNSEHNECDGNTASLTLDHWPLLGLLGSVNPGDLINLLKIGPGI